MEFVSTVCCPVINWQLVQDVTWTSCLRRLGQTPATATLLSVGEVVMMKMHELMELSPIENTN